MLTRILAFLLETVFFLLIGASLLRAYMNWLRVNMSGQPGIFVMALTDWVVKPLRRLLPRSLAQSRIDWGSFLAALLFAFAFALLWGMLLGILLNASYWAPSMAPTALLVLLGFAVKMLVRVALQTLFVLLLAYVILSWVQPGSPVYAMLARLVEPPLAPFRRFVPSLGGVDLSPFVLALLLQIGLMLLG